jgi:hypothetical protein
MEVEVEVRIKENTKELYFGRRQIIYAHNGGF